MDAVTCHSYKHTAFSPEQTRIYEYKQEYKDAISNWIAADGTARQGIHGIFNIISICYFHYTFLPNLSSINLIISPCIKKIHNVFVVFFICNMFDKHKEKSKYQCT